MRSICTSVVIAAASMLLVVPFATAADLEAEIADMKQRMEAMEDQLQAQNDELTEAQAVESLLADAIRSGSLLLVLALNGIENPEDDPCVNLRLERGIGTPLLSTQNEILPGQTFARDSDYPEQSFDALPMQCSTVFAEPVTMDLPFEILQSIEV